MKARVTVDVWFDVDNWTEKEFREVVEEAIDSYNGSADVKEIKIEPEEGDVYHIQGHLDYDGIYHQIVDYGYDDCGKFYEIIVKSGGTHKVYHNNPLVTDIELH